MPFMRSSFRIELIRASLLALVVDASPLMTHTAGEIPAGPAIDKQIERVMACAPAKGMAIAVIDRGETMCVRKPDFPTS